MTQNIEQRTEVAVKKYEGAATSVDEIAHTDKDVDTPVGRRKSFPKISREWDDESQRLQKDWGDQSHRLQTEWQNDSAVIREDWQTERNELSTKALGVKPWEAGLSESNINQQRRWTDNHTYLPKSVPAVMDPGGPDDSWIPYTADKSDTLNDVFGRKPVDLIDGITIVPDSKKQYPKLNAFGKVWELLDGVVQLNVKTFSESQGYLIITLTDDSQIVASKLDMASRSWSEEKEYQQTSMLVGNRDYLTGTKEELIGESVLGKSALKIKNWPNTGLDAFLEIINVPETGSINSINLDQMTVNIEGTEYFLDNGHPELSKCPFANWSSSTATTQAFQKYLNMKSNARRAIDVDTPVCIDSNVYVVNEYAIDLKTSGNGKVVVDSLFKDQVAVWVSGLPYPADGDTSLYWDVTKRQGGVSLISDIQSLDIEIEVMGLNLSPGDKILLMSNEAYVTTRPQYKKGEFAVVESVTGSKVRLATMVRDSYLASETKVYALKMPELQCDRFDVVRSDDDNYQVGILFYECSDIDVKKIGARGFKNRCLEVSHCYNGEVVTQRTKFSSKGYDGDSRTSYSCVVASSENIEFRGGSAIGGRHSFACGGYIPNRNIRLRGIKIAVDDVDANNVAALDSHENIDGLSVKHCEILGGANVAGQNLDVSHCDISTRRQIRALVFRPAKSCDYIKSIGNTVEGKVDSVGGIVIRPMAADIIVNHVERRSNVVTIHTNYNRPGIGIEPPTAGVNLKIEKLDEHDNNVIVHSQSVGASCYATCDVNTLENLPRIAVMNWSKNRGYITKGIAAHLEVSPESGYLYAQNGNNLQSASGEVATFKVKGFKNVRWIDNDVIGSEEALLAGRTNTISDATRVTVQGGSIAKAHSNGLKFINVLEYKVSSLERIDCEIDHQNFQSDNNDDEVKFKALIDDDGTVITGFNIESVIHDGNGRYTIKLQKRMEGNSFPISVTPSLPTNAALSNNYQTIVVNYGTPTKFSLFG